MENATDTLQNQGARVRFPGKTALAIDNVTLILISHEVTGPGRAEMPLGAGVEDDWGLNFLCHEKKIPDIVRYRGF